MVTRSRPDAPDPDSALVDDPADAGEEAEAKAAAAIDRLNAHGLVSQLDQAQVDVVHARRHLAATLETRDARIFALHRQGLSFEDIGVLCGLSKVAVKKARDRHHDRANP